MKHEVYGSLKVMSNWGISIFREVLAKPKKKAKKKAKKKVKKLKK